MPKSSACASESNACGGKRPLPLVQRVLVVLLSTKCPIRYCRLCQAPGHGQSYPASQPAKPRHRWRRGQHLPYPVFLNQQEKESPACLRRNSFLCRCKYNFASGWKYMVRS